MAYDETVAERIRKKLSRKKNITERKMFGGIAFMLNGNMCCGVLQSNLVLRLGIEGAEEALKEPCTRLMDFTGKPMRTMIYVSPKGYKTEEALDQWLKKAIDHVRTLPKK